MRRLGVALSPLLLLPLGAASAQHAHRAPMVGADTAGTRFVDAARAGTLRYRDQLTAIAEGYRRVGPDLPSMGEHWLNIRLILADSVDPARPPVLIYVSSPAGPVLAGAAYTRLLAARDTYPEFPRGLHAWHDHSGFVEEEALPMSHLRQADPQAPNATRLGILHLWLGVENPRGAWTADNWALTFVRAGARPSANDGAAHALALAADSGRYYLGVITAVARLDTFELRRLREVLDASAAAARSVPLEAGAALTEEQLERLRRIWMGLWNDIDGAVSRGAAFRLRELHDLWW